MYISDDIDLLDLGKRITHFYWTYALTRCFQCEKSPKKIMSTVHERKPNSNLNSIAIADDVGEATGETDSSAAAASDAAKDPAVSTAATTEADDDGEDFALLGALSSIPFR